MTPPTLKQIIENATPGGPRFTYQMTTPTKRSAKARKATTAWKDYRIGNALRGHYYFRARSLAEAWRKGCSIFNRGFPCRPPGRTVGLFQKMYGDPMPSTFEMKKRILGPNGGEYLKALMERARQPAEWWQPVATGLSRMSLKPALTPRQED